MSHIASRNVSLDSRNLRLIQSHPAEERHGLENGEEFKAIEARIEVLRLKDDPETKAHIKRNSGLEKGAGVKSTS